MFWIKNTNPTTEEKEEKFQIQLIKGAIRMSY